MNTTQQHSVEILRTPSVDELLRPARRIDLRSDRAERFLGVILDGPRTGAPVLRKAPEVTL